MIKAGYPSGRRATAASLALLLTIMMCTACEQAPKVNVVEAVLDEDEAAYRKQAALYEEQLQVTARQQERTEQQLQRMEAVLARWEKQADRYDAILARWERQQGVR